MSGYVHVSKESDYETIRVRKDFIPAGARLIEAYETATQIIVLGEPEQEPEGLTEAEYAAWYEEAHNCDEMGCGTLTHVMWRFEKPAPRPGKGR